MRQACKLSCTHRLSTLPLCLHKLCVALRNRHCSRLGPERVIPSWGPCGVPAQLPAAAAVTAAAAATGKAWTTAPRVARWWGEAGGLGLQQAPHCTVPPAGGTAAQGASAAAAATAVTPGGGCGGLAPAAAGSGCGGEAAAVAAAARDRGRGGDGAAAATVVVGGSGTGCQTGNPLTHRCWCCRSIEWWRDTWWGMSPWCHNHDACGLPYMRTGSAHCLCDCR
jgi:hypothetical protein